MKLLIVILALIALLMSATAMAKGEILGAISSITVALVAVVFALIYK